MPDPIDTNVVVRYLVEDPTSAPQKFQGVFPFFEKLERGEQAALLPPLVLFQCYFVLTSYYEVPREEAAGKLNAILDFKGLTVPDRAIHEACLTILADEATDLVDAYLASLHRSGHVNGVYSFDEGLEKLEVPLLPVS